MASAKLSHKSRRIKKSKSTSYSTVYFTGRWRLSEEVLGDFLKFGEVTSVKKCGSRLFVTFLRRHDAKMCSRDLVVNEKYGQLRRVHHKGLKRELKENENTVKRARVRFCDEVEYLGSELEVKDEENLSTQNFYSEMDKVTDCFKDVKLTKHTEVSVTRSFTCHSISHPRSILKLHRKPIVSSTCTSLTNNIFMEEARSVSIYRSIPPQRYKNPDFTLDDTHFSGGRASCKLSLHASEEFRSKSMHNEVSPFVSATRFGSTLSSSVFDVRSGLSYAELHGKKLSNKIVVANLTKKTTSEEIRQMFLPLCPLSVSPVYRTNLRRKLTFCVVMFPTYFEAAVAVSYFDDVKLHGHHLYLRNVADMLSQLS